MATAGAIAAVGLTLRTLLGDRVEHPLDPGKPLPVTIGFPGPERDPEGAVDDPRINLFLYEIIENCHLKNQEIPGHGHPGAYGRPPLSLGLRFLVTVFGSREENQFYDETPAHQLLGAAMQALHENAIITNRLVTARPPRGRPILDPSLADEFEQLKITLHALALEDVSNVWTALELSYRLSVAYEVNVVQIESSRTRRRPRPVGEPPLAGPRVVTVALRRPQLSSIGVRRPGDPAEHTVPYARIGDTLVLHGSGFAGGGTAVRIGAAELPPQLVEDDTIEVAIPDDVRLTPGTLTVSVAAVVPDLRQVSVPSGGLPIVLVPHVSAVSVSARTLRVTGSRLMDGAAPAEILVGDALADRRRYLAGSSPSEVRIRLGGELPASPVAALVSGPLDPFPALPDEFDLKVKVGSAAARTITLPARPATVGEAAAAIQAAVSGATDAPAVDQIRVASTGRELVLVPGDLTSAVSVAAGPLADALTLSAGSRRAAARLSGALRPFPALSAEAPQLTVEIDGTTATVTLDPRPGLLPEAATALDEGLRAAGFADARAILLDDELCVLPGGAGEVTVGPVPGADETTAAELRFAAAYLVRARVHGVESIDERTVDLP